RAEADLARRRQATLLARERVRVTGAELARLLRLDVTAEVQPVEPPHARVDLLDPSWSLDRLVEVGLTNRPELASQQAAVQATLAAEVAEAHAQADLAGRRVGIAEQGLRLALDSYDRNLEGLGQTRLIGGVNVTVVRPQEVLAAVQAVAQAYTDFYGAVAD